MPKLTFVTQSAVEEGNSEVSTERLINCYAEEAPREAKTRVNIRTVPGEAAVSGISSVGSGVVRAALEGGYSFNRIYVVQGGNLREVNVSDGTVTTLGFLALDEETAMAMHAQDVTVAANNTYYVYDESADTILTPGSGAIGAVRSVTYINGYTILTSDIDQRFEWTELGDPTTRNALYFASADAKYDRIIRAMADRSVLWIFGEVSTELWYTTGQSGVDAFARVPNGVIDRGLKGFNLICQQGPMMFFIGDDDKAYVTADTQVREVSTPSVVTAIQNGVPTRCFAYQHRGHTFAVIKFDDRPAWVFDMDTGLWHERSSGSDFGAWLQHDSAPVDNEWYGFRANGNFFRMTNTYDDQGTVLPRRMVSVNYYRDGEQFSVPELEFLCGMGRGSSGGGTVSMRFSKDGGNSWSVPQTRSLGASGAYNNRAVFRALGTCRQFAAEFTVSDDAYIPLYSDANIRVTA